MTDAPATIMYVIVMTREKVEIALMISAFNNLEVKSGNILNMHVQAPLTEKVWTTLGPEFGKNAGKTVVVVRALYGLKTSGAAFRSHLARCIESLGNKPCKADLDLWLQPEIRPEDGVQYYSYLLCYVDDILCIHHNAEDVIQRLHKSFPIKPRFGKPDMCIDVKLHKTRLYYDVWAWTMSPV